MRRYIRKLRNVLTGFRIRDHRKIEGFLFPNEAIELYRAASKLPRGSVVVEIGSWKGKSTYCLARGLKNGKVVAIDSFDAFADDGSEEIYQKTKGEKPLVDQFREKMQELNLMMKIDIFHGYSSQFVGKIPRIHLLFIDGNHSRESCEFDFNNYSPFIVSGGYIVLHDYDPSRKNLGPTWVVDNIILPSGKYNFINLVNSLWIGRKL